MLTGNDIGSLERRIWAKLETIMDPEIPAVSVVDLGIISEVRVSQEGDQFRALVMVLPTFSACPAIIMINKNIKEALSSLDGLESVEVKQDNSRAWDSNMLSEKGREKMEAYGLGKPAKHKGSFNKDLLLEANCPHCASQDTLMETPFGSTLCRSIHKCNSCGQSFENLKSLFR